MKTKLPILSKIPVLFTLGTMVVMFISCGSYQNSSYYDNDGVYGTTYERNDNNVTNQYSEENLESGKAYAAQFESMKDDYIYFTDIDNYSSEQQNDTVVTVYKNNYNDTQTQYGSWGSNSHDVTINYYNNGWGGYYGWNNWYSPYWNNNYWGWNSWYGPNWGWGWNSWYGPNWGWGWNSWYGYGGFYGNYNPYYGYNNYYNGYRGRNVVYANGPRGSRANPSTVRSSSRSSNNVDFNRNRISTQPRSTSTSPRSTTSQPRTNTQPRSTTSQPRSITQPRNNSSSPRSNSGSYSSPRSSGGSFSSPRSSGGGSFGGGGRSGGRGR